MKRRRTVKPRGHITDVRVCREVTESVPTMQKCSGEGFTNIQDLSAYWSQWDDKSPTCDEIYSATLYNTDGVLIYNPDNLDEVQNSISSLFDKYTGEFGLKITQDTTDPQYNVFQEQIIDLCSDESVPGGCGKALEDFCSQYTREQIEADQSLISLCGCHTTPLYPTDTVSPACDPLCNLPRSSKIADPETGVLETCGDRVCVIDETMLQYVDTSTTTAFTQYCGGCGTTDGDTCTCILSGANINQTIEDTGAGPTYTQYCGTNSVCYTRDQYNNMVVVDCPDESEFKYKDEGFFFPILLIIFAIILIVLIAVVFYAMRSYSQKVSITKMRYNYTEEKEDIQKHDSSGKSAEKSGTSRNLSPVAVY